jgi:hypothetical protein
VAYWAVGKYKNVSIGDWQGFVDRVECETCQQVVRYFEFEKNGYSASSTSCSLVLEDIGDEFWISCVRFLDRIETPCYLTQNRNVTLIDIKQSSLISPKTPVKYVTLSYVWGEIPRNLMATTQNLSYLCTPGSLEALETSYSGCHCYHNDDGSELSLDRQALSCAGQSSPL